MVSRRALPTLRELNTLSDSDFVRAIAPLFEEAPGFLARLAAARPFASAPRMFAAARATAHAMPADEQVELLNAHPRIGADPAAISAMSYSEQGYDRAPDQAAAEVARELHELNDAYEARFGFRYVIFVAGRPRSAIVPLLEAALEAPHTVELGRGLDDVISIAEERWRRLRA